MFPLLIQDNQPQIVKRRKNAGTGTDGNLRLPGADPPIFVQPLPHGKAGVDHGYVLPEKPPEFCQQLGRQRDLRHQQHGLFPIFQASLDEFDEDLGLPASGDPEKQGGIGLVLLAKGADPFKDPLLLFGKGQIFQPEFRRSLSSGRAEDLPFKGFQNSLPDKRADDAFAGPGVIGGLLFSGCPRFRQHPNHLLLLCSQRRQRIGVDPLRQPHHPDRPDPRFRLQKCLAGKDPLFRQSHGGFPPFGDISFPEIRIQLLLRRRELKKLQQLPLRFRQSFPFLRLPHHAELLRRRHIEPCRKDALQSIIIAAKGRIRQKREDPEPFFVQHRLPVDDRKQRLQRPLRFRFLYAEDQPLHLAVAPPERD